MSDVTWEEVGLRLRRAREDLGLTQDDVAKTLGLSRPTISLIESGKRQVSSIELLRFARTYRRPLKWFLEKDQPALPVEDDIEAWLRAEETGPKERDELYAFKELCQEYAHLEKLVTGRNAGLQVQYEASRLGNLGVTQGDHLAEEERRRLGIGEDPILNLPQLLELEGIKVVPNRLDPLNKLAGASVYSRTFGPAIFVNLAGPPGRWNFTAAHEYAHLLVDRGAPSIDQETYLQSHSPREVRANSFAASFLVPREGLQKELWNLGWRPGGGLPVWFIVYLQHRFCVSYQAMVYRLDNLGFIDQPRRDELLKYSPATLAGMLGYCQEDVCTKWERVGIGRPARFRALALQAYAEGLISIGKLVELLEKPRGEVERLVVEMGEVEPHGGSKE